jgi:hypothetical protein
VLLVVAGLATGSVAGILGNEGFEQELTGSDQGNWLVWGGAERLNWQVYEGGSSLCFKGSWSGFDYAGCEQKVAVNDAADYELSLMQYYDNGFWAGQAELQVDWRDAGGAVLATDIFVLDLNGPESQWQQVGPLALTPSAGAVEAEVRFVFGWIGAGGAYYADRVVLNEEVVLPPPPGGDYFRCENGEILDSNGERFLIRGLGVSGWLMAEGYMWQIGRDQHLNSSSEISEQIEAIVGASNADAFWQVYRDQFLTDSDLDYLVSLGMNTVRLPFNYRMLSPEDQEGVFDEAGFELLDQVIAKFKAKGIYVILDMHAAPGGAASEASGDPEHTYWLDMGGWWQEHGKACLWEFDQEYFNRTGRTPASNQARTAAIWREIAARYADEEAIIGYELINEPHLYDPALTQMMRDTFIQITAAIREVDANHIIFVEGDMFAEHIDGLLPPWDDNMAIAFHTYWKPNNLAQIQPYLDARAQYGIPLWCSESGENSNPWAYEFISLLEENNIGWSWWGWKKIDGYASGYSAPPSAGQQYVVDHIWDSSADPVQFMNGLMDIAAAMNTAACEFKPGYFEALFDPAGDYGLTPRPFAAHSIPGTINCVDYDIGTQDVAYHDTVYKNEAYLGEDGNVGLTYRSDGVDILPCSDAYGLKVAYTDSGEWLNYTVNITSTDRYNLYARVSSAISSAKIRILVDGKAVASDVQLPNTGGWDNWQTVYLGRARLKAGTRKLKLEFVEGGADLTQIIISR